MPETPDNATPEPSRESVLEALARIKAPDTGKSITEMGWVTGLVVKSGNVGFALDIGAGDGAALEPVRAAAEAAIRALPGVLSSTVILTAEKSAGSMETPSASPPPPPPTMERRGHRQFNRTFFTGDQSPLASGPGGLSGVKKLSPSHRARAALANQRPPSTSRWHLQSRANLSACWTQIFMAHPFPN